MQNELTHFGVLFDMDGVIADTNPTHKEAIRIFCQRYGKEVSEQFLEEKVYGRTNKEWLPEVFKDKSDEELLTYAEEKEKVFREMFKDHLKAVDGLPSFLEKLKNAGIKMVVATSAPKVNADFILRGLQITSYFDTVLDSSHVDKGKPEPEVYLRASKAIDMAPENCVVFEDSLSGVKAGKRAGCKVVGITTTHSPKELTSCDLVIHDFTKLELSDLSRLFQ